MTHFLNFRHDHNMTVRIKLQALTQHGSLYTYNKVPFTGEAYDHPEELLKKVYVLNQGLIIAEKNYGALAPLQSQPLQVNTKALNFDDHYDAENDTDITYYQDKPFTGISYFYVDGFCRTEIQYFEGNDIEIISWLADGTGRISDYKQHDEEHSYQFEWQYGQFAKFTIYEDFWNFLRFHMNEEQQIFWISVLGDYRTLYPQVPRSDLGLDFQTFDQLLQRDQVADKLRIGYISDQLFNDWLAAGYFSTVKHLILYETEVLPETIKKLVKLPQLTAITIIDCTITETEFSINQTEREATLNESLRWVQQQTGWQVQLKKYLGNV